MPPERTSKALRRTSSDGLIRYPSTVPNSIAFAPNITPGTFNDPPSVPELHCESVLFPPPLDYPSPRRPGHSKKKPDNHIPRPPNAFILFRSSFIKSQHVSTEVETNHSTLSKIIGLTWQNLPHDERQVWHAKAKAALDEHKRKFPEYAFRPSHTKGKAPEKRKVREVGPKDLKRCAKIAELLVEGKKGSELDAAIQEFDRHHVPEVITRFETPLTARQYRRSSSEPILEADQPFLQNTLTTTARPSRLVRSSSSQPMRRPSPPPSPPQSPAQSQPQQNDTETENAQVFPSADSLFPPSYSFPPSPEPSLFDFKTFTVDPSVLPCSPHDLFPPHLSEPIACSISMYHPHPDPPPPPPLSIDTSFPNNWTRSSSPMSMSSGSIPATPESYLSQSPSSIDGSSESGTSTPTSSLQSPLDCCGDHLTGTFRFGAFDQISGGLGNSFIELGALHQYQDEDSSHRTTTSDIGVVKNVFESWNPHPCPTPSPFHLPPAFDGPLSCTGNDFSGYSDTVSMTGSGMKPDDHLELDFAAFMHPFPQYHL